MKRKENIRAKGKAQDAGSPEQRAKSKGQRANSHEQRAESKTQKAKSLKQTTSNEQRATRKNSTVFHNSQFPKDSASPVGEAKNPKGKGKKQLTPVIIDLPEDFAIRACDLLRFFNN